MLIVHDWAFLDYEKNIKIWKQTISKVHQFAAVITDIKTCVAEEHDPYGNLVVIKFDVSTQSLHNYLHG